MSLVLMKLGELYGFFMHGSEIKRMEREVIIKILKGQKAPHPLSGEGLFEAVQNYCSILFNLVFTMIIYPLR